MYKYFLSITAFTLACGALHAQYKKLPGFVPAGFSILDTASGDLNRDGISDMVLILKNNLEGYDKDITRPLLLLQGDGSNGYRLMARNDSVVLCRNCGGMHGDPYESTEIKHGYFSIVHNGGNNIRWTRIITFAFNSKKKQFVLHRDAGSTWHSTNPNKTAGYVRNKTDFDKLPFAEFSYEKHRDEPLPNP